jgi:hypothetical protein
MSYLNMLAQSVPSAANIGQYVEPVRNRALRRVLLVGYRHKMGLGGTRTRYTAFGACGCPDHAGTWLKPAKSVLACRETLNALMSRDAHLRNRIESCRLVWFAPDAGPQKAHSIASVSAAVSRAGSWATILTPVLHTAPSPPLRCTAVPAAFAPVPSALSPAPAFGR